MEKSSRIVSQVYGYAICLVAVITILISATALITAIIDRGDPLHAGWAQQGAPSLVSFENYKSDVLKNYQKGTDINKDAGIPNDQVLRAMFDAARNDKIHSAQFQAKKTILISGLIILISLVLFFTHWRWMQKLIKTQ